MSRGLLSILIIAFLFVGQSCEQLDDYANSPKLVDGFSPVLLGEVDLSAQIKSLPPKDFQNIGRVYYYKDYMLIVEQDSGIHFLDNNSPTLEKLGFIRVPYIRSLSVKDDVLFVQFGFGLMYVDIAQYPTINVLGLLKQPGTNSYLDLDLLRYKADNPWDRIYFECPEESNKIVVDWVPIRLENPKCFIQ